MESSVIVDFLYKELKIMMESIVVKMEDEAKKYENVSNLRSSDYYMMAIDEIDTFNTYIKYPETVLIKSNIPSEILASCVVNKNNIPQNYRDRVLIENRKYIIENYVEQNNYYRMLNGQPNIGDTDFVYIKEPYADINISKPIHLMSEYELYLLNSIGKLDELRKLYPDKKYLEYVYEKKIPYNISRKAKPFQILYVAKSTSDAINTMFNNIYNESRQYVLTVFYDNAFKNESEYYDGFIGMVILFMTVQRCIFGYITTGIKMDFYDKASIKTVFDSYGLKYFDKIPITYQRKIVQNLNSLMEYKGDNKVFVEISKLFGFEEVELFKYYLLKDRKYDSDNNPIFEYKEIEDENGNPIQVEDPEKMYDLYFTRVPIDSKNVVLDMTDGANKSDYDDFVSDDIYWFGDQENDDVKSAIYDSEFSYIETKYISINTVYDVHKLNFELNYFFRTLMDLKDYEGNLLIPLVKINETAKYDLFEVIMFIFALMAKKFKYDGNILTSPTAIGSVLGFNYDANMEYVTDLIEQSGLDISFSNPVTTLADYKTMLTTFFTNKKAYDIVTERMYNTNNYNEYTICRKLYDILFVTENSASLYQKSDGTIATTYLDYLNDKNKDFYNFIIMNNDEDVINETLEYAFVTLSDYMDSDEFKYLFINVPNISADSLKKYIYYMMNTFKSYMVDLKSINTLYDFGDKNFNKLKFVEQIFVDEHMHDYTVADFKYSDVLKFSRSDKYNDKLNLREEITIVRSVI